MSITSILMHVSIAALALTLALWELSPLQSNRGLHIELAACLDGEPLFFVVYSSKPSFTQAFQMPSLSTSVVIRSAFSFSLSDALPIATLIQPSSPNIERSLSESPNTIASSHLPPKRSRIRCIPAPLSDGSTNMYSWWKRHQGSSLRDSSDS